MIGADIAEMPGFGIYAGYRRFILRIAENEAVFRAVLIKPAPGRRIRESRNQLIAGRGGGKIDCQTALMLAVSGRQNPARGQLPRFFLPIALFSVIIHAKNKLIEWKVLPFAIISGIIGAAIGSGLSFVLTDDILGKLFGGLIIIVGLKEIFTGNREKQRFKAM